MGKKESDIDLQNLELKKIRRGQGQVKVNKDLESKAKLITDSFNITFRSEEGKRVLRYIFEVSSFNESNLSVNPSSSEINPLGMAYNEGLKEVYRKIRSLIDPEILKEVEFNKGVFDEY